MSVECATTQHNIPRDLNLHAYRCENLKSENIIMCYWKLLFKKRLVLNFQRTCNPKMVTIGFRDYRVVFCLRVHCRFGKGPQSFMKLGMNVVPLEGTLTASC